MLTASDAVGSEASSITAPAEASPVKVLRNDSATARSMPACESSVTTPMRSSWTPASRSPAMTGGSER